MPAPGRQSSTKAAACWPSAWSDVEGQFHKGDVVALRGPDGVEFARGLTNYGDEDLRKIKGLRTNQIADALGHCPYDEIIHRDNMVIDTIVPQPVISGSGGVAFPWGVDRISVAPWAESLSVDGVFHDQSSCALLPRSPPSRQRPSELLHAFGAIPNRPSRTRSSVSSPRSKRSRVNWRSRTRHWVSPNGDWRRTATATLTSTTSPR